MSLEEVHGHGIGIAATAPAPYEDSKVYRRWQDTGNLFGCEPVR